MSTIESQSQNQANQKILFDLLYYFPINEQDLKDYKKIDSEIRQMISAIRKLQKYNIQEIQKICIGHKKLSIIPRFLFNEKLSIIIVNFFTHLLLSVKLLNFVAKSNVPLFIYRNIIRLIQRQKQKNVYPSREKQMEECFKFVLEYCKLEPKKFPRSFANLTSSILGHKQTKFVPKSVNYNISSKQNTCLIVLQISIQVLKNNLGLAAESQILQNLYNKVISGQIQLQKTRLIIEIIVAYCSAQQTRIIIYSTIDLGKVFVRFNNVDLRHMKNSPFQSSQSIKNDDQQESLKKSCLIIQIMLSSWPTIIYFLTERWTLTHFVNGLVRRKPLQIQIINRQIFIKIISRTLGYIKSRMKNSLNWFGYKSNCLNFRGLVLFNFLLKQNNLYQTFEIISKDGDLLQRLSRLCLEYFSNIFQSQKYNKKIIKNIKFPHHYQNFISKQAYKKKIQSNQQLMLINIKSFCDSSIIPYEFQLKEIRNSIIQIKSILNHTFSQQLQIQLSVLLDQIKSKCQQKKSSYLPIEERNRHYALLASFYKIGIKMSKSIPWKTQYLNFSKFLSNILEYLINNQHPYMHSILIVIMKQIFEDKKQDIHKFLIVTVLDDCGKYLSTNQQCQQILLRYFVDELYAFKISRVLLNIDFEKSSDQGFKSRRQPDIMSAKKLLQYFCSNQASYYLILQIIQIIKANFYQKIQKYQQQSSFLFQLIPNNLIYHKSEQVATSCIQFFEQIITLKSVYLEKYVKSIKLDKIKAQHLRQRAAFLFLYYQSGLADVSQIYPELFKEEIQSWIGSGNKPLKQYSNFLLKQVKKFNNTSTKVKQASTYYFLGFEQKQRRNLLSLPWNISINDKSFPAFVEYKMLKQKLKVQVRTCIIISQQLTISLMNIGSNSFGKINNSKTNASHVQETNQTIITIRLEQIVKNYERFTSRQLKQQKKFAVTKDQVTLFCRIDQQQNFILEKLNFNIHLQKQIYRAMSYPQNFIHLLTLTKSGLQFIKKNKVIQNFIQQINSFKQNQPKNYQALKSNLLFLGCYSSSIFQITQIFTIFDVVMDLFNQSKHFQIKQICHWIMNVIVKNQQMKKKLKQQKKWRIVQTKYCKTLFFYNYMGESQSKNQDQYNNLAYIKAEMPQKNQNEPEFKVVYEFLNNQVTQREMLNIKQLQELKKNSFSNPKTFEIIIKYMSLINYSTQKINIVFQMYKDYLVGKKLQNDFPLGILLN